jgi:hypothetical protein
MIVVTIVVLALAAPAAAAGPADGWSGWTWSSIAERFGGWADGLWRALAGSETDGEEGDGGADPVTVVPADPTLTSSEPEPTNGTDAVPEYDPDGEP